MKYKVGDKILVWRRADKSFIVDRLTTGSHPKIDTDVPICVTIIAQKESAYTIEVPAEIFSKWDTKINGIFYVGWYIYEDEAIIGLFKKEKCTQCLQITQ